MLLIISFGFLKLMVNCNFSFIALIFVFSSDKNKIIIGGLYFNYKLIDIGVL